MKWMKGILILWMVAFAQTTISINEIEARNQQSKSDSKGKAEKGKASKGKDKKEKKGGFFSAFSSHMKNLGSKVAAGAKSLKDKASHAAACRKGNGDKAGEKLYEMALHGKLTDAHVVAAHASPGKNEAGHKSGKQPAGRKKAKK